jgi:ureidoacrylate peracid hydrolase
MAADKQNTAMIPLGRFAGNRWRVSANRVDITRERPAQRTLSFNANPKHLSIDLSATAIIVIDMQNDFCHADGWLAGVGVDIAPARQPIAPLAALLPALRDASVPVLWVNWGNRVDLANISPALLHVYNGDGASIGLGGALPNGAKVLERDSWAAAVVDELTPVATDIRVDKFRMSGFWDTPLDSILRNAGIRTIMFAGVNADQCVLATLMDANFLGYDTILVEDCTATTSPEFCMQATLYNARQCFGFTCYSHDLLKALST